MWLKRANVCAIETAVTTNEGNYSSLLSQNNSIPRGKQHYREHPRVRTQFQTSEESDQRLEEKAFRQLIQRLQRDCGFLLTIGLFEI